MIPAIVYLIFPITSTMGVRLPTSPEIPLLFAQGYTQVFIEQYQTFHC